MKNIRYCNSKQGLSGKRSALDPKPLTTVNGYVTYLQMDIPLMDCITREGSKNTAFLKMMTLTSACILIVFIIFFTTKPKRREQTILFLSLMAHIFPI